MIFDRSPVDAVEEAVEGLWELWVAIWASDRAVRVRPLIAVSPQNDQIERFADIVGAAHASRPCDIAQGRRSIARRILLHPIAVCSAWPSRFRGRSVCPVSYRCRA